VKGLAAASSAGGLFGGGVIVGVLGGAWLAHRSGAGWWIVVGLFAGAALGALAALRVLLAAAR